MENYIEKLPEKVKEHLRSVTKSSGLPDTDESFEKIAQNWLEKEKMFQEQTSCLDMVEIDSFAKDDKKGLLLLTYSGSLVSMGPVLKNMRWIEYASIKLRSDVPDIIIDENTVIGSDISVDHDAEFIEGPIKKTSKLFKVVVCKDGISPEEQEKRIREATIFLTNGFVKINQTIALNKKPVDHFTMKNIVAYLSKINNLPQKTIKKILDDFLFTLECGMLMGERVPVGRIGKIFAKLKPAQKARVGRNPSTGEEITIAAKPEMYVPKMNFGKDIKTKCSNITIRDK